MKQLTTSIDQVAANAGEASAKAYESDRLAEADGEAVMAAGGSTREIAARIESTAERVAELSAELQRIGFVTRIIRELADPTNLLALDATIEAARAGEQGRGFAVVADEVRKLAERTTSSAAEIARTVDSVEKGTAEVIAAMQGSRGAATGVLVKRRTCEALGRSEPPRRAASGENAQPRQLHPDLSAKIEVGGT